MDGTVKNVSGVRARDLALTAVMAATVFMSKFALSVVLNVEPVTLLLLAFAAILPFHAAAAAVVFVCLDCIIYGFGVWMVPYFIYWPLICLAGRVLRNKSAAACALCAGALTALFGVLTTGVDCLAFGMEFWSWYVAGLPYFAVHILSTLTVVFVALKPLTRALSRLNLDKLDK